MTKQDKRIYRSLLNRIGIILLANQLVLLLLSFLFGSLMRLLPDVFVESVAGDMFFKLAECFTYLAGFCAPVVLFNRMNKNAEREIYEPQKSEKMPPIVLGFLMLITVGGIILSANLNRYIVNALWDYSSFSHRFLWSWDLEMPHQIIIFFAYTTVIPAFSEELLFRGTICKNLEVYGKGTAVLISAVLFSLMHTNVEQVLYSFVAGLLFGLIYVESGSIVYPMIIHFINNALSSVGTILISCCPQGTYSTYISYRDVVIWTLTFISLIGYLIYILKKGKIINKLVMKPDENGNEVLPLSANEKAAGFFAPSMIMFVLYSLFTMAYYVYLSTRL